MTPDYAAVTRATFLGSAAATVLWLAGRAGAPLDVVRDACTRVREDPFSILHCHFCWPSTQQGVRAGSRVSLYRVAVSHLVFSSVSASTRRCGRLGALPPQRCTLSVCAALTPLATRSGVRAGLRLVVLLSRVRTSKRQRQVPGAAPPERKDSQLRLVAKADASDDYARNARPHARVRCTCSPL